MPIVGSKMRRSERFSAPHEKSSSLQHGSLYMCTLNSNRFSLLSDDEVGKQAISARQSFDL